MFFANPQNIIPSTPASELDIIKVLSTLERNAIVRPNNPPRGISGFLFDIVRDESVDLESDITDHYVENNTAIQDHWALKPEIVTLRGVVAELVRFSPPPGEKARVVNPLPLSPLLLPEFTPGATQTRAENARAAASAVSAATSSQDVYTLYRNRAPTQPRQTRQSAAFLYFDSLRRSRQLCSVETPWGLWTNMAIVSMRAEQTEETRFATDFTVTFKKIRVAQSVTIELGQLAGRNAPQFGESTPTQNGNSGQQPATDQQEQSWLQRWLSGTP